MSKKKPTKKKAVPKKKVAPKKKSAVKKKAAPKKSPAKKKAAPKKKAAVKKGAGILAFNAGGKCFVRCFDCGKVIGRGFTENEARDFSKQHHEDTGHSEENISIICSQ